MMNTVSFTIEGIGNFTFRNQPTLLEKSKIELLVDEFLDLKLDDKRSKAFDYQKIAIQNILEEHFKGKELEKLSERNSARFDKLYAADSSNEAVIAKKLFYEISIITNTFTLDVLKDKVPEGFNILNIVDEGDFLRIWSKYDELTRPISQKKN